MIKETVTNNRGWWWLRSPTYNNSNNARDVNNNGNANNNNNVNNTNGGVVPDLFLTQVNANNLKKWPEGSEIEQALSRAPETKELSLFPRERFMREKSRVLCAVTRHIPFYRAKDYLTGFRLR